MTLPRPRPQPVSRSSRSAPSDPDRGAGLSTHGGPSSSTQEPPGEDRAPSGLDDAALRVPRGEVQRRRGRLRLENRHERPGPTWQEITDEAARQERLAAVGWGLCLALWLVAALGWLWVTP